MTQTALQPSEITMIHDILSRVADTIVQASSFAKEVEAIRANANEVNRELVRIRDTNIVLDETIHALRSERDTVKAELYDTRHDLQETQRQFNARTETILDYEGKIADLAHDLDTTRRERDDYGMKNLELQDALDKITAKYNKFRELFADDMPKADPVLSAPAWPETKLQSDPAPTPMPVTDTPFGGHDVGESSGSSLASIFPATTPAPEPATQGRRIYPGEEGYEWTLAQEYDDKRQQWYMFVNG